MEVLSEAFNKEIENIKMNQSELKNKITKTKYRESGVNYRMQRNGSAIWKTGYGKQKSRTAKRGEKVKMMID